ARFDVGDVAHPRRGRTGHLELSRQHVLGDRTPVCAVGRAGPRPAFRAPVQALLAHQPPHPFGADRMAELTQVLHQPWTPIKPPAAGMAGTQVAAQRCVPIGPRLGLTALVVIEARPCHTEQPAQHTERIMSPFTCDEGVLHLDSLAKNAVAFFKISRSILSVAFSARRRANSLSISLTGWRDGALSGLPAFAAVSQLASVLTDRSSCWAAFVGPMDCARATAWALKSSVYRRRGICCMRTSRTR